MSDILEESYLFAIDGMRQTGPKNLYSRARFHSEDEGHGDADVSLAALVDRLRVKGLNGTLRKQLHLALATWDADDSADAWSDGTAIRTLERRAVIYGLLQIDDATRAGFDDFFPVNVEEPIIVIDDAFVPWYTLERRRESDFYWSSYRDYLMTQNSWPAPSIADLDMATTKVIERLNDPYSSVARQAKGLVVGYVQSGKTANFTGVIAKAVDAGYRLIIVMTGTIDLLREQTQRRVDMELVGVENILRGISPDDVDLLASVDYQQDPDWDHGKFVRHGFLPSAHGLPDIVRLTTHRFDYKSLKAGITALEFEKQNISKPLYDTANLPRSNARLVIVKKNKSVLTKLVKDLKSTAAKLGEVPALIIDDESDLASVNTSDPSKWKADEVERTAINKLLSQLLRLLPRAQYVGYTATPFANVFIDPSDTEDIFPKDFLVSLDRPPNYMGVRDFHDIDSEVDPADRTPANSQEKAFVRDLWGADHRDEEMQRALDSYVLSGGIKEFREENGLGPGRFRHHTMLVHESVKQLEHAALATEIRDLWSSSNYSGPSGLARLENLYLEDFVPVSAARGADLPNPPNFAALKPYIGRALTRITESGDPVIVVNGDKDIANEEIDFDKRRVWRVLVGGTKLSRGFTVEGLTVSYYRRKTKQADTLMQMGRWFGFRSGYKDLVRLFIGRQESDGKKTVDLYEAFSAIVRDEEHFRDQLRKYSKMVDGVPQVTPMQIPPLVAQHLPWLRPAARNKMFNAKLVTRRSPGTPVEPTGFPSDEKQLAANFSAWRPLLQECTTSVTLAIPATNTTNASSFGAYAGVVDYKSVVQAFESLRWLYDDYFTPDLSYFQELKSQIDDCVIVMPQLGVRGSRRSLPGIGPRSLIRRDRTRGPMFHNLSDPKHRHSVRRIAGVDPGYGDDVVESYVGERRAAMLVYPLTETDLEPPRSDDPISESSVVVAFTMVTPADATAGKSNLVEFTTRNKQEESNPIVDVDK